jgi:hypothetical protein
MNIRLDPGGGKYPAVQRQRDPYSALGEEKAPEQRGVGNTKAVNGLADTSKMDLDVVAVPASSCHLQYVPSFS